MNQRVREHLAAFNTAQRSGDWQPFLAGFADDAVMSFAGVPAGPFRGRAAIAQAYAEQPPTDTMHAVSVRTEQDTDLVRFAWDAGGTGTMTLRWRDGQLASLHVAFD
ncbi:MAG: nuclear transport factor 2 family protein [Natronosporangium sp.]